MEMVRKNPKKVWLLIWHLSVFLSGVDILQRTFRYVFYNWPEISKIMTFDLYLIFISGGLYLAVAYLENLARFFFYLSGDDPTEWPSKP